MKSKKIALVASILLATLAVTVYAVVLSNTITTSWTLKESKTLELYWVTKPSGDLYRGAWIEAKIGLKNNGLASYDVSVKFKIYTGGAGIPTGNVTIQYYDGGWLDMTGVLTGWNTKTLNGYFGPSAGFPVGPGYDEQTLFRIMFDGSAPLVNYGFEAWVEQV